MTTGTMAAAATVATATTVATHEVAQAAGVAVETVELWVAERWLVPASAPAGPRFAAGDVARARFIADLRGAMGVNDAGVDVILHLVDQLHGLRRALGALREAVPRDGG